MHASADIMRRQGWSIAALDEEVLLMFYTDYTGLLEKQSHANIGRANCGSINKLQIREMSCSYTLV